MSADIHILPKAQVLRFGERTCPRCQGTCVLTYDQLNDVEKTLSPFGSVFPCPACFNRTAKIVPFEGARR